MILFTLLPTVIESMVYDNSGDETVVTGHAGRILIIVTFTFLFIKLTQRLLPVLVPEIIDSLGITAFLAGLALTLLSLVRAVIQYPGGRLADKLSRTTVLLGSTIFSIFGIALLAVAISYEIFLVSLVIFGIGIGAFVPASRALLSDIYIEKRGQAFGLHILATDVAGVLAAVISVWVVSNANWRGAFLPVLFVLVPLPLVFYYVSREPVRIGRVRLDFKGTAGRLAGDSSIRWLLASYSLFVLASSGVLSFLTTYLTEFQGFSFEFASAVFALIFVIGMFVKPAAGFVSDAMSRTIVAAAALIISGIGLGVLIFSSIRSFILFGVVIYAIGQRSLPPALQAALMDRVPGESRGGDFGGFRGIYMLIGSLGPGLTGLLISTEGYVAAYSLLLFCFLLGGGILLWFSLYE